MLFYVFAIWRAQTVTAHFSLVVFVIHELDISLTVLSILISKLVDLPDQFAERMGLLGAQDNASKSAPMNVVIYIILAP